MDTDAEVLFLISTYLRSVPACGDAADALDAAMAASQCLGEARSWRGVSRPVTLADARRQHPLAAGVGSRLRDVLRRGQAGPSLLFDSKVAAGVALPPVLPAAPLPLSIVNRRRGVRALAPAAPPLVATARLRFATAVSGHNRMPVFCVKGDASDRVVITGADDGLIKVWSADSGVLQVTIRGACGPVVDVALSPCNRYVAAVAEAEGHRVRVWEVATGAAVHVLGGHTASLTGVAYDAVHNLILSASEDETVRVWNPDLALPCPAPFAVQQHGCAIAVTPEVVTVGIGSPITSLAASPVGSVLAAATKSGSVVVLQYVKGGEVGCTPLAVLQGHTKAVTDAAWSCLGDRLITMGKDRTCRVWDFDSDRPHVILPLVCEDPALRTGAGRGRGRGRQQSDGLEFHAVAWTCDDAHVVTSQCNVLRDAGEDFDAQVRQEVKVWDAVSGALRRTLIGHTNWVHVLVPHPTDPRVLLTGGYDGRLLLWDVATGAVVRRLRLGTGTPPVPRDMASTPGLPPVQVVGDAATGASVFAAAFLRGGAAVAAADSYGRLSLWTAGPVDGFAGTPHEQYLASDRLPLLQDAAFNVADAATQAPPHLSLATQDLVDADGMPYEKQPARMTAGTLPLPALNAEPRRAARAEALRAVAALRRRWRDEDGGRQARMPPATVLDIRVDGGEYGEGVAAVAAARAAARTREAAVAAEGGAANDVEEEADDGGEVGIHRFTEADVERQQAARARRLERRRLRLQRTEAASPAATGGGGSGGSGDDVYDPGSGIDADFVLDADVDSGEGAPVGSPPRVVAEVAARRSRRNRAPVKYEEEATSNDCEGLVPPSRVKARAPSRRVNISRDWLMAPASYPNQYVPQPGDDVVYLYQAHRLVLEETPSTLAFPKLMFPNNDSTWTAVLCTVTQVAYEFPTQASVQHIQAVPSLTVTAVANPPDQFDPGAAGGGLWRHLSPSGPPCSFAVAMSPADPVEFVVPRGRFEYGMLALEWSVGDVGRCLFDPNTPAEQYFEGTVTAVSLAFEDEPESPFHCLEVRWADGEEARVSPWELEPLPGAAAPPLPTLVHLTPGNAHVDICVGLLDRLERIGAGGEADPRYAPEVVAAFFLSIPPDFSMLRGSVKYWAVNALPLDLGLVLRRLRAGYYRTPHAILADVQLIRANCETYYGINHPFVACADDFVLDFQGLLGLAPPPRRRQASRRRGGGGAGAGAPAAAAPLRRSERTTRSGRRFHNIDVVVSSEFSEGLSDEPRGRARPRPRPRPKAKARARGKAKARARPKAKRKARWAADLDSDLSELPDGLWDESDEYVPHVPRKARKPPPAKRQRRPRRTVDDDAFDVDYESDLEQVLREQQAEGFVPLAARRQRRHPKPPPGSV